MRDPALVGVFVLVMDADADLVVRWDLDEVDVGLDVGVSWDTGVGGRGIVEPDTDSGAGASGFPSENFATHPEMRNSASYSST